MSNEKLNKELEVHELQKKLDFYKDELADTGHMGTRMRAKEKIWEIETKLGIPTTKPFWL